MRMGESIENELISIIIPTYNSEKFLSRTLKSVLVQTHKNWEAIIVDDCSTDSTLQLIRSFANKDKRIKFDILNENQGAAVARNKAVEIAKGPYVAFLDSDDLWYEDKLFKQLQFMKNNGIKFSCTSYNKIDATDKPLSKVVYWNKVGGYEDILKRNPGNSTIMYHAASLGKIKVPNIRKRNDYLMWLQVIKVAGELHPLEDVLSSHRIREGSLSSNKFNLVKYHWEVYRKHEKLGYFKAIYLLVYWSFITIFKLR